MAANNSFAPSFVAPRSSQLFQPDQDQSSHSHHEGSRIIEMLKVSKKLSFATVSDTEVAAKNSFCILQDSCRKEQDSCSMDNAKRTLHKLHMTVDDLFEEMPEREALF